MDNSNNYINQNEELRNALLDLLFGNSLYFPNDLSNNNLENIQSTTSIDNDYINFFRSYIFRNRPQTHIMERNTFESILQQSFMDPSQNMYKKVLSHEGEEAIKIVKFKKGEFPNDSCPVTLMDFEEEQEVAQLPCKHIFMKDAVMKWLKVENASCPVCRKPLASKEVKKENKNVILSRTPSRQRPIQRNNFIQHYVNREIQREEDVELQAAIIASLREQTN